MGGKVGAGEKSSKSRYSVPTYLAIEVRTHLSLYSVPTYLAIGVRIYTPVQRAAYLAGLARTSHAPLSLADDWEVAEPPHRTLAVGIEWAGKQWPGTAWLWGGADLLSLTQLLTV